MDALFATTLTLVNYINQEGTHHRMRVNYIALVIIIIIIYKCYYSKAILSKNSQQHIAI